MGSRDRSWGVRPVGLPDSQPSVPAQTHNSIGYGVLQTSKNLLAILSL